MSAVGPMQTAGHNKPMVQAASYPPLQKTQGRGTHSPGTGSQDAESRATRPTSYRVQATVKIETDQSVRGSSNPVVSTEGKTSGSAVDWYGLGTQTGRTNVSATANGTYDQNGNAVVQIKVSGSDPLVPGAPPAAGTFSVTVDQGANQV